MDEFSKCIFQWGRVFFRTSFSFTCAVTAVAELNNYKKMAFNADKCEVTFFSTIARLS